MTREFCVATEFFYVAIEGVGCTSFLCRDIRFYVATRNGHNKGFAVTTKLAMIEALCRPR